MAKKLGSVDPSKFPDEQFDYYSIPAFDTGASSLVAGSEIGSSKQIVQPGDVLLSRIVPHIRRAWVVRHNEGHRIIGSGEWIVFRSDRFFAPFLRHLLISDTFHPEFMRTVSGVGGSLLRARPATVALINIDLPSLEEQQRIAAILDQAEALQAKRRQALAKLDTLTQSLFLDLSTKGNPSPLSLKEIVTFKTGKLDSNAAEANGRYPFFTCAKEDAYINTHAFDQEALLLAGNNAAGEYSVKHFKGKFNAYQRTYVISVDESQCTYEYVRYALQSKLAELKYQSKGTGTKYLTLEILNRLKVPLPSIQGQQEFSSRLKGLGIQEAAILKSDLQLKQLQSTLEHRAFRGEL